MEGRSCETPGCELPAKLQCPTCIKLGIQVTAWTNSWISSLSKTVMLKTCEIANLCMKNVIWTHKNGRAGMLKIYNHTQRIDKCMNPPVQGSFFCNQQCFKANWDLHKVGQIYYTTTNPSLIVGKNLDFLKLIHLLRNRLFTSWQRQTVRPSLQRRGAAC